jgi:hypothetical protein
MALTRQRIITSSVFMFAASNLTRHLAGYRVRKLCFCTRKKYLFVVYLMREPEQLIGISVGYRMGGRGTGI